MKESVFYLQVLLFNTCRFFWAARRGKILTGLKGEGENFIIAGVFKALHLIKQFKQHPWAGDRVAQLQILLCEKSLKTCLGICRYTNTPGFLKPTSTYIQNAKLSRVFLVSPPAHSSICSILSCLTWASSQCPSCAHTDQPQPRKAIASPWWSAWLEFRGAGVAFAMPYVAKVAGKGPICYMTGSGFILHLCSLTSSANFLLLGTLSLKLTKLSIAFLWAFFELFW